MLRVQFRLGSVAALLVALAQAGCGDGAPAVDSAARYTPESLASELVFRYKTLNPERRNVAKPRPTRAGKAETKAAKAATKEAEATSLDDLVRETMAKAARIANSSQSETVGRIVEAVNKESSVPEADRKVIADRLRAAGE